MEDLESPYPKGSLWTEGWDSFFKDRYHECPYPRGSEEERLWGEGWTHAYESSS